MNRKVFYWIALGLIVCAGCVDIEPGDEPGVEEITLQEHHAYIVHEEGTRTDFDGFTGSFAWSKDDVFAMHYTDGTYKNTAVDYKTGVFSTSSTSTCYRDAYAIYPASAADPDNYGSSTLNVFLPYEYDIKDKLNSIYSPVPMIAENSEEESDLYFRHLGGLLRITCNAVPAGTRRIAVSLNRNIAGTFTVSSPASKTPSISSGGDRNTVSFIVSEYGLTEKTDGIVLNLPVPTGAYTTLTVTPYDGNNSATEAFTRDINLPIIREQGKKFRFSLTEVVTDSMQLIVTAGDATGWTYTLPFYRWDDFPASLEIDWGDGYSSSVSAGMNVEASENDITHSYSSAGDHTITITATREGKGAMIPRIQTWAIQEGLRYGSLESGYDAMLKSIPTPLLYIGGYHLDYSFINCFSLENICSELFSKNQQLTVLNSTFYNCHRIQIPNGLFDCLPYLDALYNTFEMYTWAIESQGFTPVVKRLSNGIPSGLFDHNPNIRQFNSVFINCNGIPEIPAGLFDNNINAEAFHNTFRGCSGITGPIPSDLFENNTKAISFYGTFAGCTGLSGYIPENLFANNLEATNFSHTFSSCSGLTGPIPEYLFVNNEEATDFSSVFYNCSGLTGSIPEYLFSNNHKVTDFSYTFANCSSLTGSIPVNLFKTNPYVTSFAYVFDNCTRLSGTIPANLFSHQTLVTDFSVVFGNCRSLSGAIPEGLFSSNLSVNYFQYTFFQCTGLSGSIPENLFSPHSEVRSFYGTFCGCHGLSGEIPANLFANNTKATSFGECFYECYNLKSRPDLFLPTDRFEQCTEEVNFYLSFYYCGRDLTDAGEAPALWNYSYGNGVNSNACFRNAVTLSNYDAIDDNWKQ